MRRSLVEWCVFAIGRMWSWYADCPKRDHEEYVSEIGEMTAFARRHADEVLRGRYPIKTKALVLACGWPSPVVYAGLHALHSLRHLLRGDSA